MSLLLIIVAKKKPRALLENDAHVYFFMELPFWCFNLPWH